MKKIGITVGSILLVGLFWPAPAQAQESDGWTTPPPMEHQLEKRQNCVMCHAGGGVIPNVPVMPENHKGRPNEVCLLCHGSDAEVQTVVPKTIPHELEERGECLTCHQAGAKEDATDVPASHEGRKNEFCVLCHQPAAPSD